MYPYEQLEKWRRICSSSFYILDVNKLAENYQRFQRAFTRRYERVVIAYSYKTNYLPFLCQKLHELGAYAEVVSRLEYDLAGKLGVEPASIIFNGPLKSEEDIEEALGRGSLINLDSFAEIPWVVSYAKHHPEQTIRIGLRINVDLTRGGVSPLQNGYGVSRFGFCVENGNLEAALSQLAIAPNVQVVGLHGHFSTNRSIGVYRQITRYLCRLGKEHLGCRLEFIDIGGGFYGELPASFGMAGVPTFEEYAEAITAVMKEELAGLDREPVLILEPGISLVADAIDFVCQVADIKENRGERFVLVDGSIHNVKPTMHTHTLPARLVSNHKSLAEGTYHVVGYTCMEKDYLLQNYVSPMPQVGDYFVFGHVGAYTLVFNPPFIRERPPVLAIQGQEALLVRGKETLDDFIPESVYRFQFDNEGVTS